MSQTDDFNLYTPIARYTGDGSTTVFDLSEEVPEGDARLTVTLDGQKVAEQLYSLGQRNPDENGTSFLQFTTAPPSGVFIVAWRYLLPVGEESDFAPETPYNRHIADGTTHRFPFNFLIQNKDDLSVFVDGKAYHHPFHIEYANVQNKEQGGTVVFVEIPASSLEVLLIRTIEPTRFGRFHPTGMIDARTLNSEFDRLFMLAQDLTFRQQRSLYFNFEENNSNPPLPKKAERAGKILGFNETGEAQLQPLPSGPSHHKIVTESITSENKTGAIVSLPLPAKPGEDNILLMLQARFELSLTADLEGVFPFYWSGDEGQTKSRAGFSFTQRSDGVFLLSLFALYQAGSRPDSLTIGWDFSPNEAPNSWTLSLTPASGSGFFVATDLIAS